MPKHVTNCRNLCMLLFSTAASRNVRYLMAALLLMPDSELVCFARIS